MVNPNKHPKPIRGRPRDRGADARILKTSLRLVERIGFRSLSIEAIADESHVARTTIYRRWPNKAAVIMDAFLAEVGPDIAFPELPSALESLRIQMKLLARAFRGRPGLLIRSLLAEAQFDPALKKAFRGRWIMKRRAAAEAVIKAGILAGELPAATDPDVLLDALYGGLYYRLLMGTGSLNDAYVEAVWRTVLQSSMLSGLHRQKGHR
jgi:AcrR family transcriptional regulator